MSFSGELYKFIFVLALILPCGCGSYSRATVPGPEAGQDKPARVRQAEFVGVPIIGDYDDNRDLDFVLRVDSAGRVLKIRVHEDSKLGNSVLLDDLQTWINEIVDVETVKVSGKFTTSHEDKKREYGSLELESIAFLAADSRFGEPYDTNPQTLSYYLITAFIGLLFISSGR